MLGKFGETEVVDWGLARVVGRAEAGESAPPGETLRPAVGGGGAETAMGAAVGTPAYMSPEQAAGRWDVIDQRSDVYGLGAVLYTVLTSRAPIEGAHVIEVLERARRGQIPRPRALKPSVPRALEAVCRKAMALRPEDRYPSARALAAEVELWLADEPVRAYREPAMASLRRIARRHKGLVGSGMIALVLLVVSGWVVSLKTVEVITADAARKTYESQNIQLNKQNLRLQQEVRELRSKERADEK
jgi:serine/threonine protein kinase